MPDVYRAPEVILGMDWDIWVDIWSVAMVVGTLISFLYSTSLAERKQFWDLVKGSTLFNPRNEDKLLDDRLHLAEMIAIMGPPPKEFLERSEASGIFWDTDGMYFNLPPLSLPLDVS